MKEILEKVLGNYYRSGGELLFYCPSCEHHKRKLSINLEKNVYKCWVCNMQGRNIRNLIRRYGKFIDLEQWDELSGFSNLTEKDRLIKLFGEKEDNTQPKIELPGEFISLVGNRDIFSLEARRFLSQRGVTKQDIYDYKIGYCEHGEYGQSIVIPSFDKQGEINYFVSRAYIDKKKKYNNPRIPSSSIIFNELMVDYEMPIILTEGVFDAMKVGQNAVPILGSILKEESRLFYELVRNKSVIYLSLDPDAHKKEMKLVEQFLKYGIDVYKVNVRPYKDVGEMPKKEFEKRKKEAIKMNKYGMMKYRIMLQE